MTRQRIQTADAPAAIGPYSQAIASAGTVWCSGQIGLDPATGELVPGGIEAQTQRVFANIRGVLAAAGTDLGHVVKTTVFLKNMSDFAAMNAVYATHLPAPQPARSTVEVARLPKDALVEIEVIATLA